MVSPDSSAWPCALASKDSASTKAFTCCHSFSTGSLSSTASTPPLTLDSSLNMWSYVLLSTIACQVQGSVTKNFRATYDECAACVSQQACYSF